MRILNASTRDTAGIGRNTALAFARHARDWRYNAVKLRTEPTRSNWLQYPIHTPWSDAAALAAQADVIHANNSFKAARLLGALDKPLVLHHHGTLFRNKTQAVLAAQRELKAVGIASTLDLWLLAPDELEWLPAPYDLDWLASLRKPANDGVLRIGHAPTSRAYKSTDAFLRAVEKLGADIPIELVLIEREPWERCLEIKGTCDVFYDQVALGYGSNSIEAWGMGIPVIAGGADDTLAEMEARFGSLPFVLADEGSIYEALVKLTDPAERTKWSHRGLDHVQQWHDEKPAVEQLKKIYQRAAR